jgi:hypothetical protein
LIAAPKLIKIPHAAINVNKTDESSSQFKKRHERISRDELKQIIRNTAFTTIGREFHVDGNTIKQWCKAYGLPSRKSDIKQYSDEEWEMI